MGESEEYVVTVDRDIHGELIRASDGTPPSPKVTHARWKHRMVEAMCDRFHWENGYEPEPARGDCEDRSDVTAEVQPAEDVGQAESET